MSDTASPGPQPGNHGENDHTKGLPGLSNPGFSSAPSSGRAPCYCLRCRSKLRPFKLHELEQPRCPQCRLPYDPNDPATYTARPMLLRWWFWLPGFCLAVLTGVAAYAFILWNGQMGYALFLGVSFGMGAILGYATRVSVWLTLLLTLLAVPCVVLGLLCLDLSGVFCGLTLGGIFVVPALGGAVVGWLLRVAFRNSSWDYRRYYFLACLVVLPFGGGAVENHWPVEPVVAEVRTSLTFRASLRETWDRILFYEQVEHEPPWLLTLALPRPVRAEGSKAAVGDVQRCIYRKGYLVKQVTRREEPRLLAFRVTEQHLHFEHDVTLLNGSFTLEPLDAQRSRVVLTTRYIRHLRPAWFWEPLERRIVHTLHGHVLEGMRRNLGTGGEENERRYLEARPEESVAAED